MRNRRCQAPPASGCSPGCLYFESALALIDVLDSALERDVGIPLRSYDAAHHLEDEP